MAVSGADLKQYLDGHRRAERVLRAEAVPGGSEAAVSLGLPGYEEEAIARGVAYDLGEGRAVRVCSAEDLVIHKALAGRVQDVLDIEGIVARQWKALDVAYVRRWLVELGRDRPSRVTTHSGG